jgi:hypothetical protein
MDNHENKLQLTAWYLQKEVAPPGEIHVDLTPSKQPF